MSTPTLARIPTTAPPADLETYVGNIVDCYRRATLAQLDRGHGWYATAHDLAEMIAHGDTRMGAGVLAAMSPQTGWTDNVTRARAALSGGRPGHTGDALRKVARIMAGEDPLDVLPTDSKTWSFFQAIVDPTDPTPVVIDRHAHDIAVGVVYGQLDRGLSNRKRYATLAEAYRVAAFRLDVIPSALQATTWIVHRDDLSGTDHRGVLR